MKRSEINASIDAAQKRFSEYSISLPPFAYFDFNRLKALCDSNDALIKTGLGWDVTDFGSGDFSRCGAVLFTLRNGLISDSNVGTPYAEKYMVFSDNPSQEIPLHYHIYKTEDIINRAGGIMCVQVYNSNGDKLDYSNDVKICMDGISYTFPAGSVIEIEPGCSITLRPYLFHRIFAKKDCGMLIAGEVSKVNDDRTDNVFLEKTERYCQIDEDESARYILVSEYDKL